MVDNDMPGAWPVWTPGVPLAGFIKRCTIHCFTQNTKSLGQTFFMFFQFSPDLVCCIPNIEALTIVVSEKMSLHVTLVTVYADLVGFTQV